MKYFVSLDSFIEVKLDPKTVPEDLVEKTAIDRAFGILFQEIANNGTDSFVWLVEREDE